MTLLSCPSLGCCIDLLNRSQRFGGHVQSTNNREKLSGDAQQGSACATLLRTVPEIAVSLFKKWGISVTSQDSGVIE
jgi:hypothetical protein